LRVKHIVAQDVLRYFTLFPTNVNGQVFRRPRVKKLHCLRGHLRTPENLCGAKRHCRQCASILSKARYQHIKAERMQQEVKQWL
jgi:hypothetical protein